MSKNYVLLLALAISFFTFGGVHAQRAAQGKEASFSKVTKGNYPITNQKIFPKPVWENKIMPFNSSLMGGVCDTVIFEDFQNQTIPATWGNLDLDGHTDANGRPQNFYIMIDQLTSTIGDTNWVAAASSWFTPFATANNWLILDSFTVCSPDLFLVWKSAPFEGPVFADGYKVKISTTTNTPAAFTTTLATFAESVNGTATQSAGIVHPNYVGGNGLLTEWSYNLGSFYGQKIYVAFVHDSNDDNLIMLDDISVLKFPQYDMSTIEGNIQSEYFLTPLPQVQPYGFDGRIRNNGLPNTTNPKLHVNVLDTNLTLVYQDSAGISTLGGLTDTALSMTKTFTTGCIGFFETQFIASADEADPIASNDTLFDYFAVTDSTYARDKGGATSALGFGAGESILLGQQFTITQTATASSATFYLTGPSTGDTSYVKLFNMSNGQPNAQIATSAMIILDTTQNVYQIPFTSPVTLTPGEYVLVVQESQSGYISLGTSPEIFTPAKTWVFLQGQWGNNEDFGFFVTYLLRLNFSSPPCSQPVAGFTSSTSGTAVTLDDTTSQAVCSRLWDFGDGFTSTKNNPIHTYSTGGAYTVCLMVQSACGTDTICDTLLVACQIPVASFTQTVSNKTGTFTDNSTNGPTAWAWDFGDGGTSTQQNPVHTFPGSGVYTVCLVITNACGMDTVCNTVTIICNKPAAAYAYSSSNTTVTFTDQTTNSPTAWSWDFGDGSTSSLPSPSHNYGTSGTWTACLTATNVCGADTFCQSVTVCVDPTASFTATANNDTVTFTSTSTSLANPTYSWDFGDGNSSTAASPTHIYGVSGTYTACLILTDACGSDTSCNTVQALVGVQPGIFGSVNVYPNPNHGKFQVEIQGITGQNLNLQVTNVVGKVLWNQNSRINASELFTTVDLNEQGAGIYFLTIESENQRKVYKLLID